MSLKKRGYRTLSHSNYLHSQIRRMIHLRFYAKGKKATVQKVLTLLKSGLETEDGELRLDWTEDKLRRILRGLGYRFRRIRDRVNVYERDDLVAKRHAYIK